MRSVLINLTIACSCFLFVIENAHSQIKKPGITLGGYLTYSNPKGNFTQSYRYGGGGEVFGGIGMGKTFVIATAGFSQFKPQSGSHSGALQSIPVKIGLKQFILRKLLFVNADIGKATVKNAIYNKSRFTRGIGAGVRLLGLEGSLYYDGWKNLNARGFSNSMNVKIGWNLML